LKTLVFLKPTSTAVVFRASVCSRHYIVLPLLFVSVCHVVIVGDYLSD